MKRPVVEVEADSCEFPGPEQAAEKRLHIPFRPGEFGWDGVTPAVYKSTRDLPPGLAWRDVVRHTFVGADGGTAAFQLRYFEIAPGGFSSLEKHHHVHAIITLRGTGDVIVGREVFSVAPFDIVYVPPDTPHQFVNTGNQPFGFLCPVDAERDAPMPLSEDELDALRAVPAVRAAMKIE